MQKILLIGALVACVNSVAQDCAQIQRIQFLGLVHTRPEVVQRELHHKIGSCFDSLLWQREKNTLKSLDVFAGVSVEMDSMGVLNYRFRELPAWVLLPALNKTDRDGWSLGAQGAFLNLWGRDIRVEGRWSTALEPSLLDRQEGFFQMSSPWLGRLPLDYKLVYAHVNSWQKTWTERSDRAELELNYPSNQVLQAVFRGDFLGLDTVGAPGWQVPYHAGLGGGFKYEGRDLPNHPSRGWTTQSLLQVFGPSPSQFGLWLQDVQLWLPLGGDFVLQTGALWRQRVGRIPTASLYQTGGPNSLRSYVADSMGLSRQEGLGQVELQWRIMPERSFVLPVLGWDLYTGIDVVAGFESAYLSAGDPSEGQYWPGLFGGVHVFVPGFERIRVEVGYPLRGPQTPQLWIGLFQKISTQLWTRR